MNRAEGSGGEDFHPEAAAEIGFQKCFGTFIDDPVHPMAGLALLAAEKFDALKDERTAEEGFEIDPGDDEIPAEDGRREVGEVELDFHLLPYREIEEGGLALEIRAVSEVSIALEAHSGNAPDFRNFGDAAGHASFTTAAPIIVSGGDENPVEVTGDHFLGGFRHFDGIAIHCRGRFRWGRRGCNRQCENRPAGVGFTDLTGAEFCGICGGI